MLHWTLIGVSDEAGDASPGRPASCESGASRRRTNARATPGFTDKNNDNEDSGTPRSCRLNTSYSVRNTRGQSCS
ncbi:hypothetical protein EYF80_063243 [Liparis tanakae]|uniref:Uncharacterized protein n=1 Tax=Liparis tanakae TaxID=230148 RepID=A0A4Z2ED07_9TELE|nr:hypothetical protein EYF80_063243 [Liparis tanakae]